MGRRAQDLTLIMVKIQTDMVRRIKRMKLNRSAVIRDALTDHVPKLEKNRRATVRARARESS